MRCLVTGGAGFIGSHVAEGLLARGHEVTILDSLVSGSERNLPPGARFVKADIRDDEAARLVREWRPEVLYHLAAQMDVRRSVADPAEDARVNILGFLNLLEAARHAGVGRVVMTSTGGAVYGDSEHHPTPEDAPTEPACPYGVSKLAGEKYLHFYALEYGLATVVLRLANVYGPRQNPHGEAGVVAIFARKALSGEPCTVYGDGEQTRDYVHVSDVVTAQLAALDVEHGVFNIGTGREATVKEIQRLVCRAAGSEAPPIFAPAKPGEQRRSCVDPRRATQRLGWHPARALEEGIAETVEWFRQEVDAGR